LLPAPASRTLDVTDESQWEALMERIRQERPRVDILVHAAGISGPALWQIRHSPNGVAYWPPTLTAPSSR
jgi:NAD(P)-dependent dehydrogenase (short-subunit alcohol dehydrogenase family)